MALIDNAWQLSVGGTWLGTLTPTGEDGQWVTATFEPGDGWGNFAPWFSQAYAAFSAGDEAGWQTTYSQLTMMGLAITADDGQSHANPTVHIDGSNAWFSA